MSITKILVRRVWFALDIDRIRSSSTKPHPTSKEKPSPKSNHYHQKNQKIIFENQLTLINTERKSDVYFLSRWLNPDLTLRIRAFINPDPKIICLYCKKCPNKACQTINLKMYLSNKCSSLNKTNMLIIKLVLRS